ncbi:MAG: hypothetical protein SGJ04_09585, partial [Bacteroidota bacterium]|nr:hypothetical protein [Bacteroidota bacterium]
MNKHSLLLIILLSTVGFVQDIRIKNGRIYKKKGFLVSSIAGYSEDGGFLAILNEGFNTNNKEITLEKYDENLDVILSREIKTESVKGEKIKGVSYQLFQKRLLAIISSKVRKGGVYEKINAVKITNRGAVDGTPVELHTTKDYEEMEDIFYFVSSDSSKLILVIQLKPEKDKVKRVFVKVFDKDLKPIWQKTVKLNYDKKYLSLGGFAYTTNKLYIAARLDEKVHLLTKSKPGEHRLLCISDNLDTDKPDKDYIIQLDGKFISSISFAISFKNNVSKVQCVGLYGLEKEEKASGVFSFTVDEKTDDIIDRYYKTFDKKVLDKVLSKREKKREEDELQYFKMRRVYIKEDGGIVAILEQENHYPVTNTYSTGNGMTRTISTNHYEDNNILVLDISQNSGINWMTIVPKIQHTINDYAYFNSFCVAYINKELFIFYSEDLRFSKLLPKDEVKG